MSKPTGLNRYFKPAPKEKQVTPEPPRRAPSPPHEYTLADNDTIAFLVMFRSRFSDAFPKSLPHYGPQDIERGVSGDLPDEGIEKYLCALLGLVLNRKKDVEYVEDTGLRLGSSNNVQAWSLWKGIGRRTLHEPHTVAHGLGRREPFAWRAVLQQHVSSRASTQWPSPYQICVNIFQLDLLRALVMWSLNQSEAVQAIIKESWKQTRRDDDKNQPRSVQPWFSDSYRRRFWLIEGQEDSFFRVYRENDGKTSKSNTWFSVAGSIDEINALADKFTEEGTQNGRLNADKLRGAIPRFEQGEDKRKRREYRQSRKAAWTRPAPGFSLYEGRTRGKRARYTFDDEEDYITDGTRRSTRNATPVDAGPVVTASGRQVKSRVGGMYGESLSSDQRQVSNYNSGIGEPEGDDSDDVMPASSPTGRSQRAARAKPAVSNARERYDGDEDMESDSDDAPEEGDEWSGDENEPDDDDESEGEMSEDDGIGQGDLSDDEGDAQKSLVVRLSYRRNLTPVPPSSRARTPLESNPAAVSVPLANGFGGDATSEALPHHLRLPQQQDQLSGNDAPLQNGQEPSSMLKVDEATEQHPAGDTQESLQDVNVTTNAPGDAGPTQAQSNAQPPGFQPPRPVASSLKTLTPPSSLPETAKDPFHDIVPAVEKPQTQQQYQLQPQSMDVS